MRNRIAAAAAAGILTIGMAALPSAASASEVAPSTDGLAGSTTISGQIDQDMAVCTDKTCDAVQHVRKTNQQIKSDIDTAKQHAEQLHQTRTRTPTRFASTASRPGRTTRRTARI